MIRHLPKTLRRALGLLLIVWAIWPGCAPAPAPEPAAPSPARPGGLWAVDDMTPLAEDTEAPATAGPAIALEGGANETVAFQVVFDPAGPLANPRVRPGELVGPDGARIGADRLRPYRMWPATIGRTPAWTVRMGPAGPPRRLYDVLVPLYGPDAATLGARIDPGRRLALWVDLDIPPEAPAGLYRGTLAIEAEGAAARSVAVELTVLPIVLPDHRPMTAIGGFDHQDLTRYFLRSAGRPYRPRWLDRADPTAREALTLIRQLMRLAHAHRLDLFDTRIAPLIKRSYTGALELDWSDYDEIVRPYLDGSAFEDRIGVRAWPAPLWTALPDPANYGGVDSPEFAHTVAELARLSGEHFEQLGFADRLFYWPIRRAPRESDYPLLMRYAGLIGADADAPLCAHLPPDPPELLGWRAPDAAAGAIDMLAPPAELLNPAEGAESAERTHPLAGAYLWPTNPPYAPSLAPPAPPADVRAAPWLVRRANLAGLMIPDVLDWPADPLAEGDEPTGGLFYCGARYGLQQVLPSVRLKHLRRGLDDQAYLWLLGQRNRAAVAETLTAAMARYVGLSATVDHYLDPRLDGWVRDADTWRLARSLLAREVVVALQGDRPSQQDLRAARIHWRRLDEAARSVQIERVLTRVEPDPDSPQTLRVTVSAELYNQLSRSVEATLAAGVLPAEMEAVPAGRTLELAPGQRAAVELTIRTPYLPTADDGKYRLPLTLEVAGQLPRTVEAPAALLVTRPMDRPPTIDGRLDDWPMRAGALAAGFRPLGDASAPAAAPTFAWLGHDAEHLYAVIRCDRPDDAPLRAEATNIVQYRQLIAAGEDMVELVLDPGLDAEGASDLYHLIVKSNGVLIAERGVRSDPPLGDARGWGVTASAAVRVSGDYWIAELALPRADFGAEADATLWGVNIARYDTGADQSSSWAEPPRYYYHPRGLGTWLLLAPREPAPPAEGE